VRELADLRVDIARRRVTRGGQRIELTAKEYALLDYFLRHTGEVVSRTLIAEHVWDMHFDSDTNVVDVAVRRLRAKLDDPFERKLIHTVRGVGYLFEARESDEPGARRGEGGGESGGADGGGDGGSPWA
jgi:two-component system copper resistance phosphate regulon response regulator CusR